MAAVPPAEATTVTAVAEVAHKAAEAAGDSLLDSLVPMLADHPWSVGVFFALALLRAALPWFRKRAGDTATKWDDRVVAFGTWLLFGIKKRSDEE